MVNLCYDNINNRVILKNNNKQNEHSSDKILDNINNNLSNQSEKLNKIIESNINLNENINNLNENISNKIININDSLNNYLSNINKNKIISTLSPSDIVDLVKIYKNNNNLDETVELLNLLLVNLRLSNSNWLQNTKKHESGLDIKSCIIKSPFGNEMYDKTFLTTTSFSCKIFKNISEGDNSYIMESNDDYVYLHSAFDMNDEYVENDTYFNTKITPLKLISLNSDILFDKKLMLILNIKNTGGNNQSRLISITPNVMRIKNLKGGENMLLTFSSDIPIEENDYYVTMVLSKGVSNSDPAQVFAVIGVVLGTIAVVAACVVLIGAAIPAFAGAGTIWATAATSAGVAIKKTAASVGTFAANVVIPGIARLIPTAIRNSPAIIRVLRFNASAVRHINIALGRLQAGANFIVRGLRSIENLLFRISNIRPYKVLGVLTAIATTLGAYYLLFNPDNSIEVLENAIDDLINKNNILRDRLNEIENQLVADGEIRNEDRNNINEYQTLSFINLNLYSDSDQLIQILRDDFAMLEKNVDKKRIEDRSVKDYYETCMDRLIRRANEINFHNYNKLKGTDESPEILENFFNESFRVAQFDNQFYRPFDRDYNNVLRNGNEPRTLFAEALEINYQSDYYYNQDQELFIDNFHKLQVKPRSNEYIEISMTSDIPAKNFDEDLGTRLGNDLPLYNFENDDPKNRQRDVDENNIKDYFYRNENRNSYKQVIENRLHVVNNDYSITYRNIFTQIKQISKIMVELITNFIPVRNDVRRMFIINRIRSIKQNILYILSRYNDQYENTSYVSILSKISNGYLNDAGKKLVDNLDVDNNRTENNMYLYDYERNDYLNRQIIYIYAILSLNFGFELLESLVEEIFITHNPIDFINIDQEFFRYITFGSCIMIQNHFNVFIALIKNYDFMLNNYSRSVR